MKKTGITRIRQKSADLRKIVNTALERNEKKLILQEKQMKDTEKKDKYRIYGELLNTYGYSLSLEDKFLDTVIIIPENPSGCPWTHSSRRRRTQKNILTDTAS